MPRYIDADERIEELESMFADDERIVLMDYPTCCRIIDWLKKAPTADVVQVKNGRWKSCGGASSICSECNVLQVLIPKFNYCPNCGAKMDLED